MGILRLCKFWEIFKRKIKNDQKIRPLKMKNYIRMTSYIKKIIKGLKFDFKRFKYEVNIDSIYNIKYSCLRENNHANHHGKIF